MPTTTPVEPNPASADPGPRGSVLEVLAASTRLGLTSFGGTTPSPSTCLVQRDSIFAA